MLDIREQHEYSANKIKDSINVPRGVLEAAACQAFPESNPALRDTHDDKWLIVCATGGRAALATDTLQTMGFSNVASIAGGITAWKDANKDIH